MRDLNYLHWEVHYDRLAPRKQRYRVFVGEDGEGFGGRGRVVMSFGTHREALACGAGFVKGMKQAQREMAAEVAE